MASGISRNGDARRRIIRCIAFLFLFYTAVNLACPQLCSERLVSLAAANQTLSSGVTNVDPIRQTFLLFSTDDASHRNQPGKQEPQDEGCFCCCSHLVLGTVFMPPVALQHKSVVALPQEISNARNEFETPYHPPRFS